MPFDLGDSLCQQTDMASSARSVRSNSRSAGVSADIEVTLLAVVCEWVCVSERKRVCLCECACVVCMCVCVNVHVLCLYVRERENVSVCLFVCERERYKSSGSLSINSLFHHFHLFPVMRKIMLTRHISTWHHLQRKIRY